MSRGRQTRTLRPDQIARLEKFRRAAHDGARHGYSYPQLRLAMAATFGWETLKKAIGGLPVWDLHHSYIAQWIERYLPAASAPVDGKAAASGERDIPAEITDPKDDHSGDPLRGRRMDSADVDDDEEAGATGTVRGSR